MKRQNVKSSNLKSIGYDKTKRILEIEFIADNRVYQYFNVDKMIFDLLIEAKSKGSFFDTAIRYKYRYTEK